MKKSMTTPTWVKKSPWLDPTKTNLFRDEFQLAQENLPGAYFTPLEPYRWIYEHHGVSLFFKGLACYAPMFPVIAYNGQIASWISPPPSGLGNAIYMVIGHDKNGTLRLVGGNYFTEPTPQRDEPLADTDYFSQYDVSDDRDKRRLVLDTVSQSIRSGDISLLQDIRRECEHFHTRAIYITVLTSDGSLFHAAKAVIEGDKPADFSYEWFGEIQ
jgi:hypothetical protein